MTTAPLLVNYSGLRVHRNVRERLWGVGGYRPIVILFAAALIILMAYVVPVPGSLKDMVTEEKPAGYSLQGSTTTVTDSVNYKLNRAEYDEWKAAGFPEDDRKGQDSSEDVARMAMVMLTILLVAGLFWGTEALPIGGTVLLVAGLMYFFQIMAPNDITKAFMKDSVFFIMGILAIAVGVSKTGLDKRIGLLLLSRIKSALTFALIFFPILAVAAGFLSEHALVALLCPVLLGVYKATCMSHGVKEDKALAVFLLLGLTFAANMGGPGSPAAGGRNAVMVGYFSDFGMPISFTDWIKYGLPIVPMLALTVGIFMYVACKRKFKVKNVNPSEVVRREAAKLPKLRGKELIMTLILCGVVIGWILSDEEVTGLGGVTMFGVVAMFLAKIIDWRDVQRGVAFDVVGLYAAATAIGAGLAFTGGALWMAREFVDALPGFLNEGDGLVVGVSILTGVITNFMSDGATVSALGPIVLPMAELGDVAIWKVGLMCSFASSFAMMMVVGTPNNAIVYSMARDPETGKQLITVFDFFKYGFLLWICILAVLIAGGIYGYWSLLDFPANPA